MSNLCIVTSSAWRSLPPDEPGVADGTLALRCTQASARSQHGARVTPVLAHQGGWDEALIFAVPVVLYLVVRFLGRGGADEEPQEDIDDVSEPR